MNSIAPLHCIAKKLRTPDLLRGKDNNVLYHRGATYFSLLYD